MRTISDFDGIVLNYNLMALAINYDGLLGGPSIIYSELLYLNRKMFFIFIYTIKKCFA
jgi:hypothetical protein